jgi:formyltetrahydrofolate synthetase
MLDNHIYHGNELGIDTKTIQLKRTIDMNDRAIRKFNLALNENQMTAIELDRRAGDSDSLVADVSLISSVLDFKTDFSINDGIESLF